MRIDAFKRPEILASLASYQSTNRSMSLHGHCNCNAVQVTLKELPEGDARQTAHCRCTTCKRDSGAGGMYVTIVDEGLVEIEDPTEAKKMWMDNLTESGKPAERWSCRNCSR